MVPLLIIVVVVLTAFLAAVAWAAVTNLRWQRRIVVKHAAQNQKAIEADLFRPVSEWIAEAEAVAVARWGSPDDCTDYLSAEYAKYLDAITR